MPNSSRVLVVGTTADYIDWIRRSRPGRALFLTDRRVRTGAHWEAPAEDEEIPCDMARRETLLPALKQHLARHAMTLSGIVCYDCEHLAATADLAHALDLPYPSREAVMNCRNKFTSKSRWVRAGVPCPRFRMVCTLGNIEAFAKVLKSSYILKPLTGSGGELTFRCRCVSDGVDAFHCIREGLDLRRSDPMYRGAVQWMLMEECVSGQEYSCDFVIRSDQVEIVRLARKYPRGGLFGTSGAYELISIDASPFEAETLRRSLHAAAVSLGITEACCMVDLFERDGQPVFLELSPRPGGDCLPWLLRAAWDFDTVGMAIDFAEGMPLEPPGAEIPPGRSFIGLRLFAEQEGVIKEFDGRALTADPRVREVYFRFLPGHSVRLPPVDYDSWILGHVVYQAESGVPIEEQNRELIGLFTPCWETVNATA